MASAHDRHSLFTCLDDLPHSARALDRRCPLRPTHLHAARLLLFVASLLAAACAPPPEPEPLHLLARAEPLLGILADCSLGEETQAARWCAGLAERIAPCEAVEAACSEEAGETGGADCRLAETVTCRSLEEIDELGLPAGTDLWLRGPLSSTSSAAFDLRAVASPERIRVALTFEETGDEPWTRWLPEGTLEAPRLAAEGAFLVAQYRPEGGLVPPRSGEPSFADRLYGLRSELFSAAVLDGDVELAVFPPGPRELFPRVAAFLGAKRRELAARGMESYIEELSEQWPIQRLDYEYEGRQGACLDNLRVMPEFAPCYLATPDGLALGWNRQSLEQAMPTQASAVPAGYDMGPEAARLVVDVGKLALADQRLARALDRRAAYTYPFRALSLRSLPADNGTRFEIEVLRRPPE